MTRHSFILQKTALVFAGLFPFLSCSASFVAEDYEILKQTNSCPQGHLAGSDLSGQEALENLRGASLVGAVLTKTNLTRETIYGADIRGAQLPDSLQELDVWNVPGRTTRVTEDGESLNVAERYALGSLDGLRRRSHQGEAFSQFAVAFLLEIYGTLEEDKLAARSFYEQASDQKYWPAINNLGWMYEWGYGVDRDLSKAYDLYQTAAFHEEVASFNVTRFEAIYRQDREAFYSLGAKYKSGRGVPEDMSLAFYWLQKAADQGHIKACRYAGMMCQSGTGTSRDLAQALVYFQRSSDPYRDGSGRSGDPESQYALGRLYETGHGIEQDYLKARFWYEKAAEVDDTGALMHLGKLHEEGKGGPVSFEEALKCYQKVGSQGRLSGLYHQGRMLEHLSDDAAAEKAVQLYLKVLEKDPTHTGALFLLGTHFQKGTGLKKNLKEARSLYQQAAESGHGLAKLRSYLIEHRGQIDEAEIYQHRHLFDSLAQKSREARRRVERELSLNYRIADFDLTKDYEKCFNILTSAEALPSPTGRRMHFQALPIGCKDHGSRS